MVIVHVINMLAVTTFFLHDAPMPERSLATDCTSEEWSEEWCTAHTKCPLGKYTKTAGTTSAQPECEGCPPGFFKDFTSMSSSSTDTCIAHAKCPPGKYTMTHGSETSQPFCEFCFSGFFKAFTSNSSTATDSCVAHSNCPPGKYTKTVGTASAQPKCESCATGFFKSATSKSSMCIGTASDPSNECPYYDAPVVLFQAQGRSSSFKNTWTGWYSTGPTVSSGFGKRTAYDTLKLSTLRLSDGSGRFVEYKLNDGYAGRTLLSIVQGCMGSNRRNTGSSAWNAGLCSNVGTRTSSSGSFGRSSLSEVLRIGVGDRASDAYDWGLLMPLNGNGNGDYNGQNVWVFGGETQTNNGYTNTVTISMCSSTGLLLHSLNPSLNAGSIFCNCNIYKCLIYSYGSCFFEICINHTHVPFYLM